MSISPRPQHGGFTGVLMDFNCSYVIPTARISIAGPNMPSSTVREWRGRSHLTSGCRRLYIPPQGRNWEQLGIGSTRSIGIFPLDRWRVQKISITRMVSCDTLKTPTNFVQSMNIVLVNVLTTRVKLRQSIECKHFDNRLK